MKEVLIQVTLLNADIDNDMVHDSEVSDPSFSVLVSSTSNSRTGSDINFCITRTNICRDNEIGAELENKFRYSIFSRIKIRTGHKTLNEAVMNCFVQCSSEHEVMTKNLRATFLKIGNPCYQSKI